MTTLTLTAQQAIERSTQYDEIVTIEGSKEIHEFLRDECSDSVEHCVGSHQLMTEYWKNDPDSDYKMTWRVHVLDDPDAKKAEHELAADARARSALDMVTIETMPDHLRSSHRAARNWGVYPMNGAERREVSREEADEIVAADADGYDHIVE